MLAVVEHGAVEELERERDLAAVTGEQGQCGGEPASGAQPGDADALGVDAELVRVARRSSAARRSSPRAAPGTGSRARGGSRRRRRRPEAGTPLVEQRVVHVVGADDVAAAVDGDDRRGGAPRGRPARCTRTGTGGSPGTRWSVRTYRVGEVGRRGRTAPRMAAIPSWSMGGSSNASSTGRSSGSSRPFTSTSSLTRALPCRCG